MFLDEAIIELALTVCRANSRVNICWVMIKMSKTKKQNLRKACKQEPVTRPLQELESDYLIDLLPELPRWVMKPDYERVDWFNKFVSDMWPYLDKAICASIRSTMRPYFAEYIGRFQIKSIDFQCLSFGSIPPTIDGMKVYDSNENELVFEVVVRWAGNPNIILALQLLSMKITAQLVDVQITTSLRIILRPFVPTFPCFSSIVLSLIEKPQVDFGLKVMGGDIMSIPGLYHFVQESIRKQVARVYLWPQTYEVQVLDSSLGTVKKPVGILHVKVVKAMKLLNVDFMGASDPYVKLSLTGESLSAKKTSVIMDNLNPVWNEDFKMTVKDPESQALEIHVYDWEKIKAHDKLGMQLVPLENIKPYEKKEFALNLLHSMNPCDPRNKKQRGWIILELTFVPFQEDSMKFNRTFATVESECSTMLPKETALQGSGLLLVSIIGATDIEGKHQINPYALILFRGERRRTKMMRKSRNPVWNEEFEFVLEEVPLKEQILIEIISKRRSIGFKTKESLGYVEINLADVVYNGHMNEKYHLINSRDGIIHIDIRWKAI